MKLQHSEIDQDLILSQAWVNCDFLALGGGVYFKIRDFRGAFIRGGVYSRKYGMCENYAY